MTDYYATLGVDRGATQDEIKRAYRKLARQYHPDTNPHDPTAEERFKEVSEAYEVLNDPARRERYDMFGDSRGESPFGFGDLGDIMETFFGTSPFGGVRRRRGPERGGDLATSLVVTLEEAARGTEKVVTIEDLVTCGRCKGSGCEPGTFKVRCERCSGSGAVQQMQRSIFGTVMTSRTCGACTGAGEMPASPCRNCGGRGIMPGSQKITVAVPPGVREGTTLRLGGRGRAGERGGPAGDLFVQISVERHPVFDRVDDDLHCTVSVPFTVATLGGEVAIPTLDGDQTVHIDAGTRSGTQHKLRGRGSARLGGRGQGDVVAHLVVEVPRNPSAEERELIARLAEVRGETVDADRSIVSKIKGAVRKTR